MIKKTILFIFLSVFCLSISAEDISLNGNWSFAADSLADYSRGIPAGQAMQVMVPHTWNVMAGLEDYVGRCWYQRDIDIPADMKGKCLRLHFGAAYHDAVVYINGNRVGQHKGAGYTPFSFDVSKIVKYGQKNRLCVSVDNSFSDLNLPFRRKFDWTADGGLYRDVWIHVSNRPSIRYVHVTPVLNLSDSTGTVSFSLRLHEADVKQVRFSLLCRERKSGKIMADFTRTANRQADGCFHWTSMFGKVEPWHFDRPHLYTFTVKVLARENVTDSSDGQFGFRRLETKGRQLLLNGEPVRLPGIEYMAGSSPCYGSAEPMERLDSVVTQMKRMNIAITRFHWPQDDRLLTLMDERGILVQEEIPWWQQPDKLSPQLTDIARQQVDEMVEAHYNHPCIVMWGLSNEVRYNGESLKPIRRQIESLDKTRLVNVVCNHTDTQLHETVTLQYALPTWNEYTGTWNGNDRYALPAKLDTIRNVIGDRPLFITELGCCEPAFTGGDARRTDDMIYHIDEYTKHDFICGYIYFCLNDYRTQVGEEGYGRHRIRRHGVTDKDLQPKPSYYQLQAIASPVKILKIQSAGNQDRDIAITIKVSNTIPHYILQDYTLVYTATDGSEKRLCLPRLIPGEEYSCVLRDISPDYHFYILRPGDYYVTGY